MKQRYDFNQWMSLWPPSHAKKTLEGDQALGLMGLAQSMLFRMKSIMTLGGIKQHKMSHVLADGSIITVQSVFGNDFIHITLPEIPVTPIEEGGVGLDYYFTVTRDDGTVITESNGVSLNFGFAAFHSASPLLNMATDIRYGPYKENPVNPLATATLTFEASLNCWKWSLSEKFIQEHPDLVAKGFWFDFDAINAIRCQNGYKYKLSEQRNIADLLKPGKYAIAIPYFDLQAALSTGDSRNKYQRTFLKCSVPIKITYRYGKHSDGSNFTFLPCDANYDAPPPWYSWPVSYETGWINIADTGGLNYPVVQRASCVGKTHSHVVIPGVGDFAEYNIHLSCSAPSTVHVYYPLNVPPIDFIANYTSFVLGGVWVAYWELDGYRTWYPGWTVPENNWSGGSDISNWDH